MIDGELKKEFPLTTCGLCGEDGRCFHEARYIELSPGPHFWRPRCQWLIEDDKCPRVVRFSCLDCSKELIAIKTEDSLYTDYKCSSCGFSFRSS